MNLKRKSLKGLGPEDHLAELQRLKLEARVKFNWKEVQRIEMEIGRITSDPDFWKGFNRDKASVS